MLIKVPFSGHKMNILIHTSTCLKTCIFFSSVSINYDKVAPSSAFTEFWSEIHVIVLVSLPGLILTVFNQQLHEMGAT